MQNQNAKSPLELRFEEARENLSKAYDEMRNAAEAYFASQVLELAPTAQTLDWTVDAEWGDRSVWVSALYDAESEDVLDDVRDEVQELVGSMEAELDWVNSDPNETFSLNLRDALAEGADEEDTN